MKCSDSSSDEFAALCKAVNDQKLIAVHITTKKSWSTDAILKKFITQILNIKEITQLVVLQNTFVDSTDDSSPDGAPWRELIGEHTANEDNDTMTNLTKCGILRRDAETSQSNPNAFDLRVV